MSSVAAAAASTATTAGGSEASQAADGCERADGSAGPPAPPGSASLAPLPESASALELGALPDSPSALAPPEDEESQTTYGSWQEEAPRPVDLSRAVSFVAPSEFACCRLPRVVPLLRALQSTGSVVMLQQWQCCCMVGAVWACFLCPPAARSLHCRQPAFRLWNTPQAACTQPWPPALPRPCCRQRAQRAPQPPEAPRAAHHQPPALH